MRTTSPCRSPGSLPLAYLGPSRSIRGVSDGVIGVAAEERPKKESQKMNHHVGCSCAVCAPAVCGCGKPATGRTGGVACCAECLAVRYRRFERAQHAAMQHAGERSGLRWGDPGYRGKD